MTKLLMSGAPTREEAAEIWTAAQTAVFASVYELVSIMPPAHREQVLCETSILLRDNGIAVLKKYAVHEEEEARAELNKQHAGAAS